MTKAKTKRQRRRTRRASRYISLAGGQSAKRRITQGRRTDRAEKAVDLVALKARAKRASCTVEEARDVLVSDDIGLCIRALVPDMQERRELFDVWQGLSASYRNYAQRCLSIQPSPQSAALAMVPDQMQTDPSLRVDLRTEAERDSTAREAWFGWLGRLMTLKPPLRAALRGHLHGYAAPVWAEYAGKPTATGENAVAGLKGLRGVKGEV